ncbi:Hypothetical predicted protein [Paramuricea clavata]|uniref:Uncharacterized protein n=1 Tax=Paramuricea clavata TaxID=317549 RepID=A0A7D9I989_PARCT|nr:Hypothetical predicted protein [Paramuricea clavata]
MANKSAQGSVQATKEKKYLGKYCIAGGPNKSTSCFHNRIDINLEGTSTTRTKRLLDRSLALPTIDTVSSVRTSDAISSRERRQFLRHVQREWQTPRQTPSLNLNVEAIHDIHIVDQTPSTPCPSLIYEQATSSLTTVESSIVTPISSELPVLTSSKEQCKKLRDSLRKGKVARRKLKLKVQQLEKTNKSLVNKVKKQTVMIDQVVNNLHTDESDDDDGEDIEEDWEPTNDDDDGDDEIPANEESRNVIRVDASTTSVDEPKFIVFYQSLLALFSLFCFNCKAEKPEVRMEQNEYVTCIKKVLLTLSKEDLTKVRNKYLAKVPAALNTQFADRKSKIEAVQEHGKRKKQVVELPPSAQEQETLKRKLEEAEAARQAEPPAKKQRCCRKCKSPMLGHPCGHCMNQAEEN